MRLRGRLDAERYENSARHRRVPARLRRQRLEHVRARARPARARPRRSRSSSRDPGTPATSRATRDYDGLRIVEFGAPRRPCRTSATTSRTSGSTRCSPTSSPIDRHAKADRDRPRPARADGAAVDRGGATRRFPSVCTVRDYWPVCYWSDLIHTTQDASLCPGCSAGMMTRVHPAAGRRALAAGAADDSVHARQPGAQAPRARRAPTR